MEMIPFVREGLGNSSYLVELGSGNAALIDPDRSVARYLQTAESRGWNIAAVLETHLHADFVSGAREIAQASGAAIFSPEGAECRFPHHALKAGERLPLDGIEFEAIASPGHSPEHMSYLLRAQRYPPSLFSGGAIIVGGAARTDLISPEMTQPLTRALFRTLKDAFSTLPDETFLYPTHGGGSFCSTGAGGDRSSTLGKERAHNPLLSISDEEEFVRWFPTTFPATPSYFFRMRAINQAGPRLRAEIPAPPPLSPAELDGARQRALVIDVRPREAYMAAHVPGSLSNSFRSGYATWLGWLVPPQADLLFVTGDVPLEPIIEESLLVGYESFAGYLADGLEAWVAAGMPVQSAELVDADGAHKAILDGAAVLDVRETGEFKAGHIQDALHIPLGVLEANLGQLSKHRPILTYCARGDRAATAVSYLERAGFAPVLNLNGGISAWREAGYPLA